MLDQWTKTNQVQPLGLSTDRYFGTQIADTVICFALCDDFVLLFAEIQRMKSKKD